MSRQLTITARPNRNGNTTNDMRDALRLLDEAKIKLGAAHAALMLNVAHGRNYPHHERPADAAENDRVEIRARVTKADEAIAELQEALTVTILEAIANQ